MKQQEMCTVSIILVKVETPLFVPYIRIISLVIGFTNALAPSLKILSGILLSTPLQFLVLVLTINLTVQTGTGLVFQNQKRVQCNLPRFCYLYSSIQSGQLSWQHVRLVLGRSGVQIWPSPIEFSIGERLPERF